MSLALHDACSTTKWYRMISDGQRIQPINASLQLMLSLMLTCLTWCMLRMLNHQVASYDFWRSKNTATKRSLRVNASTIVDSSRRIWSTLHFFKPILGSVNEFICFNVYWSLLLKSSPSAYIQFVSEISMKLVGPSQGLFVFLKACTSYSFCPMVWKASLFPYLIVYIQKQHKGTVWDMFQHFKLYSVQASSCIPTTIQIVLYL